MHRHLAFFFAGFALLVFALILVSLPHASTVAAQKPLSEKDIDRIAQQWDEEDEDLDENDPRFRHLNKPQVDLDSIRDPKKILEERMVGQTKMFFVHVKTKTKAETEKLGLYVENACISY
jgi:hypothetical protein